jgi:hypothetical protein
LIDKKWVMNDYSNQPRQYEDTDPDLDRRFYAALGQGFANFVLVVHDSWYDADKKVD